MTLLHVGVGALLLAHAHNHVDETAVVLKTSLGAATGLLLLVLVLSDLGGLLTDLTGTGQRTVNLATTKAEHQVEGRLLLDVVVAKSAAIFQLLAGEDEALLVRGNALLVLNLSLDVVDRVRGLDLEGDGLACASMILRGCEECGEKDT